MDKMEILKLALAHAPRPHVMIIDINRGSESGVVRVMGKVFKPYAHDARYEISMCGEIRKRINVTHPERGRPYRTLKPYIDKENYERIRIGKRFEGVHRYVYEAWVGPLLNGMVVCHLDNNRRNNHYSNLLQTTQKENISHKILHGTEQKGSKHGRAKITEQTAREIKNMISDKVPCVKIARRLNVSAHIVYDIKSKGGWRHV
jgi:hypothetical protein